MLRHPSCYQCRLERKYLHVILWSCYRSGRSGKSTFAAKILAASEAVAENFIVKGVMTKVLRKHVKRMIFVDFKDLFRSLSSNRPSTDKYVRNDFNLMRFFLKSYLISLLVFQCLEIRRMLSLRVTVHSANF